MILNEAFKRAHALASAHGHWWSRVVAPRPQGWWFDDIAAAQTAAISVMEKWEMVGLLFSLEHTTATGRLGWSVAPDGAVTLSGCRKGSAVGVPESESVTVAQATVDVDGNVGVTYPRGINALSAGVVGALKGALSALSLGEDEILLALGPEAVALWAAEQMASAAEWLRTQTPRFAAEALEGALPAYLAAEIEAAQARLEAARRVANWAEMRRPPPLRPRDRRPVPRV